MMPAIAETLNNPTINPCNDSSPYGCGTGTTYTYNQYSCVETADILFENQVYECKTLIQMSLPILTSVPMDTVAKSNCWQGFATLSSSADGTYTSTNRNKTYNSGLTLKRKIDFYADGSSLNLHDTNINNPCVIKPKDSCNINVPEMVKATFAHKFPYDILGDNPFPNSSPSCPVITIMSENFPACWLLNLVKGLKYPLLLIFVFGAITRP